jgi:putative peptidoglycan lipid II flippase
VVGLLVLARPIIRYLFEYGAWTPESTYAVAVAIMIQVLVLPAMLVGYIYSRTLYAAQDVKTPVRTSIISLGTACAIYLGLFGFVGYLAIPIGIVVSGYLKTCLLGRACQRRGLFKIEKRPIRAVVAFAVLAMVLGAGLWLVPISSIWALGAAMVAYIALYLPAAMFVSKVVGRRA